MTAVAIWWRHDLRRRWPTVVGLVLLAGLAAAVPIAAVAGARRTGSVIDRAREASRVQDGSIERGGPDAFGGVPEEALADAASLPYFEATATFDLLLMRPTGSDYFFAFEFFVISPRDTALGTTVNRFTPVDGRVPRVDAVDEVLIDESAATALDLEPGDTISLESWTNEARDGWARGEITGLPARDGPVVDVTVVGVIPPVQGAGSAALPPTIVTTAAFHDRYVGPDPDQAPIGNYPGIMLFRLAEGRTFDEVHEAVREIETRYSGAFSLEDDRGAGEASELMDAQQLALMIFAAISAAAGLLVVGQAVSRHLGSTRGEIELLRSLGLSRRARIAAVAASAGTVAVGGGVIAGVTAWWASAFLPLGTAGDREPSPGRELNLAVVGTGVVITILVVLVWAVGVGWSITRVRRSPPPARVSAVPSWLGRHGLPVTARLGVHLAVERGAGPVVVPVRTAFVGAAAALAGLTGAIVFNNSLSHLLESPDLYGWEADAYVVVGPDPADYRAAIAELNDDDRVARFSSEQDIDAPAGPGAPRPVLDGAAVDPSIGPPLHTIVDGREPRTVDEISLGPQLAEDWGVGIGDTVEFPGRDDELIPFEVVGISLMPEFSFDSYRDRFTVLIDAAANLQDPVEEGEEVEPPQNGFLIDAEPGTEDALVADLRASGRYTVLERRTPAPIANLAEVDRFPPMMAAFLGLLAAGFLLHAVVVAVRERRRDLAVAKILGFHRNQVARAVAWQATTIAAVGVAVGVPTGVVVGRVAFTVLADAVSVPTVVVLSMVVLMAASAAILVANLAALAPSIVAARTRPAAVLRAE